MANAKKKVSKKAPAKKSNVTTLPAGNDIPEGMKQMGGGYAPTWKPEDIGDSLHGVVSKIPASKTLKIGRKTNETRVLEITTDEDVRFSVWESAVLGELFDTLEAMGDDALDVEVFLHYDGLGKKKAGQNQAKLFTVAMAE